MRVEIFANGKRHGPPVYLTPGDKVTYVADGKHVRISTCEQQLAEAKKEIARWAANDGAKWTTLVKIASCSSLEEAHRLARTIVGEPYGDEGDDW